MSGSKSRLADLLRQLPELPVRRWRSLALEVVHAVAPLEEGSHAAAPRQALAEADLVAVGIGDQLLVGVVEVVGVGGSPGGSSQKPQRISS